MSTARLPAGVVRLFALTATVLLVAACAPRVTEERQVGSFTSISASNGVEVHVVVGGSPSASVTATQAAMDEVTVRVEGSRLQVSSGDSGRKVTVDVTIPSLAAIDASSSASVIAEGVTAATFDVNVSSDAEVEVSGTTGALRLNGSSQSEASLGELVAGTATVDLSSQAKAEVQATESVTGDVSSQAKLTVVGSPARVDVKTSSQGEVVRR